MALRRLSTLRYIMYLSGKNKEDRSEKERRLPRVKMRVCYRLWWRWLGSLVAAATMLHLFLCKDTSPCVFSFFFLFFFPVFTLSVLSSIFVLLLSFFFFSVFSFFLSIFFFSSPPFAALLFRSLFPYIYRQKT